MGIEGKKEYSLQFKCDNCFKVFSQKFPYGIRVDEQIYGCNTSGGGHWINCPNCGSGEVRKMKIFDNGYD